MTKTEIDSLRRVQQENDRVLEIVGAFFVFARHEWNDWMERNGWIRSAPTNRCLLPDAWTHEALKNEADSLGSKWRTERDVLYLELKWAILGS